MFIITTQWTLQRVFCVSQLWYLKLRMHSSRFDIYIHPSRVIHSEYVVPSELVLIHMSRLNSSSGSPALLLLGEPCQSTKLLGEPGWLTNPVSGKFMFKNPGSFAPSFPPFMLASISSPLPESHRSQTPSPPSFASQAGTCHSPLPPLSICCCCWMHPGVL